MQIFYGRPQNSLHFHTNTAMYKTTGSHQLTFEDFNQSCGMQLNVSDEWCILASLINWAECERIYSARFKSGKGHPAAPVRQALGALIIQKRMKLSDRALVKAIAENPYYQYFIGLEKFSSECPFTYTTLVLFRRRIDVEFLQAVNETLLRESAPTAEHARQRKESVQENGNAGTMILDATCSPSNIRFPQDFSLLNEAREKTDALIDDLHSAAQEAKRPRTYRRTLHAAYLNMAKSKKRSTKAMRSLVRKLLCALARNLGFIDKYLGAGGRLPARKLDMLDTIRRLYAQQKRMFDSHTHRVEDRIVSLSQPYIRPIVRGKAKTPVEFGAKYDVSIDEKGHARLEKISFDAYNECAVFKDATERYWKRTGHYPRRVLVDKIYNTKENREYCQEHGIRLSVHGPGRPKEDRASRQEAKRNQTDRIEVERFFSKDKRCCGAGLIVTKLAGTTLASIALSLFVANLFGTSAGSFFVLYLLDVGMPSEEPFFIEFSDDSAEESPRD